MGLSTFSLEPSVCRSPDIFLHSLVLLLFDSDRLLTSGTDYAAPEVLQGKSYRGKEQDVWALGILLYTLIYKENPFYSIDEIMDHELRIPWIMSEPSIDLIKAMLNRDVDQRLTISQVMEHPWSTEPVKEEGQE